MEKSHYYQKEPNQSVYRSTFTVLVFIPKWSRKEITYGKLDVIFFVCFVNL